MAIITYTDLNKALEVVVGGSPFYSQFLTDAFFVMYHSGCRPIELQDRNRWSFSAGGELSLQPAKGNNLRKIPLQVWPSSFVGWVNGSDTKFRFVTYYNCGNLFHHLFPLAQPFIGLKQADQYLFRHRYVKSLAIAGRSVTEIKQDMGWVSDSLVTRYVNSVVYN